MEYFVAQVSSGRIIRSKMRDTIVALGSATKDGVTLFGKNSDRELDEVQNIKMLRFLNYQSFGLIPQHFHKSEIYWKIP